MTDCYPRDIARAVKTVLENMSVVVATGMRQTGKTTFLTLAPDRSDVIITSGGIAPTVDDVTRQAVANATGRKQVYRGAGQSLNCELKFESYKYCALVKL